MAWTQWFWSPCHSHFVESKSPCWPLKRGAFNLSFYDVLCCCKPSTFRFFTFFLRNLSYGRQKEAKPLACLGRVWHCMDWKGSTQEVHESVFNSTHLSGLLQKRGHTCVRTLQDCLDWICCASSTPSPFNASQENICHGLSCRQCFLRL